MSDSTDKPKCGACGRIAEVLDAARALKTTPNEPVVEDRGEVE